MIDHTQRRDQEEGHPWNVEAAIFDPDTGDVAYILKGVKLANAIDARIINAAPSTLEVAEEVVRVLGEYDGAEGDIGNLYAEAIAAVAKAKDVDTARSPAPDIRYLYGLPDQEELGAHTVNEAVQSVLDDYHPEEGIESPATIVIAKFQRMELEWGSYSPLAYALEMLEGEDMGREEPFEPTEKMREAEKGFMDIVLAEYRVWSLEEVPGERVTVNVAEWIREHKPEWRL